MVTSTLYKPPIFAFSWSKALVTVLTVAVVLLLLDYTIHTQLHDADASDDSEHDGISTDLHVKVNHHVDSVAAPPANAGAPRGLKRPASLTGDVKQKQNRPLQLPGNNDLNARNQAIVNPQRDVGFRRAPNGRLVFDPDAVLKAKPLEYDDDVDEVRDPIAPKKQNSVEKRPPPKAPIGAGLTEDEKAAKAKRQSLMNRIDDLYGQVRKAQGYDDDGNFHSQGADTPMRCDVMTRPTSDEIEMQNEQWQLMDGVRHEVYLHSAYLDARQAFDDTPAVRVMLVISGVFFHGRPHCIFWYDDTDKPVSIPTTVVDRLSTKRKHFVNNIQYSMYMFTCKIPSSLSTPNQVSMVMNPCESPYNILQVILPYNDDVKQDFAVCVIGQWARVGDVEAAFLTEWIEAYSMFGVGEINIYNVSLQVTPMVQRVIDHYTNLGRLRLIHQTAPVTALDADDEYDASQLCLRTSANDCLLRNVNRYKYIMVIDRDEIIVPRKHDSYQEMVKFWANSLGSEYDTFPAVTVQNSYFYMNFEPDESQPAYMATLRYPLRQPPDEPKLEYGFQPGKAVTNVQRCKIVWNHNCQLPATPKALAPVSTAMLHHYRRDCFVASRKKDAGIKERECEWIKFRAIEDRHMLKYKVKLQGRVDAVFEAIGINSTHLSNLLLAQRAPAPNITGV